MEFNKHKEVSVDKVVVSDKISINNKKDWCYVIRYQAGKEI